MRSKSLILFSVILGLAAVYRWLPRSQPAAPIAQKFSPPQVSSQSLASTAPPQALVAPPRRTYTKSVGAHQGPPIPYQRGDRKPASGQDHSPFDRFVQIKRGAALNMGGHDKTILAAGAIPTAQYNSSYGPVLFNERGYSVVAWPNAENEVPLWSDLPVHSADRPVVMSPSGHLGVVTGTLMVKVSDSGAADRVAGQENLQLLYYSQAISTAYFRAPENYGLVSGAARIRNLNGVKAVDIEVVEGYKEAQ